MPSTPQVTTSTRLALVVVLAIATVLGFTVVAGQAGATPSFDKCLEDTGDYEYCITEYRRTTTTTEAPTTAAPTTAPGEPTTTAPGGPTTTVSDSVTTTAPGGPTTTVSDSVTTTAPGGPTTTVSDSVTTTAPGGGATTTLPSDGSGSSLAAPTTVPAVVEGSTSNRFGGSGGGDSTDGGSGSSTGSGTANGTVAGDLAFTGNTARGPVGIGLVVLGVGIVAVGLRRRRTLD